MLLTNRQRRENEQNKQICKAPEQPEVSAIPDVSEEFEFVDVVKVGMAEVDVTKKREKTVAKLDMVEVDATKKRERAKRSEYEKLPKPSIRFDQL